MPHTPVGHRAARSMVQAALLCLLASCAPARDRFEAGPIDLGGWTALNYRLARSSQEYANWVVAADRRSVTQTQNADPSIFLSDRILDRQKVQGTWLVERSSDDDLIGFVFGFLDPGHFYVFDWKGRDQEGAECGMSVKRVDVGYSGATSGQLPPGQPFEESELWYTAGVEGRTRLIHHEDTPGWEFDRPYTFQLETQRGWFRIIVKDGSHTLYDRVHHDSNYDPGRFGFYNYSQERVVYRGFETIESPADRVSVWRFAIAGALLIIVIAALVAQRRRRHIQEG